ncbi:host attachment protein [Tropicimonas sp.]|uniref:baeRF12 domain-containing protein n=1 Tax=Tropicimonas sp. TaxID=2067044 RepID=UPI003A83ACA7
MTRISHGTWVLIADGEKALFLRNDLDAQNPDLNLVIEKRQDDPPNREQQSDRPGRRADGGDNQRSAMEEADWHRLAKERFADELARLLYSKAHDGAFTRLVIVAPPVVLGELRRRLHKEVADKVVAEIPKTLTNVPLDRIEKSLKDDLAKL